MQRKTWSVALVFIFTSLSSERIASAGTPICDYVTSEVKTIYFGIEVPTPDPDHPATVSLGHTDLDVPYRNCEWDVEISPESGQLAPADALLYGGTQARFTLASIPPGFEFIGAAPGETFWILPQNQMAGVIFLGVSSESMTIADRGRLCEWNPGDPRGGADVPAKWIRIELAEVRGPEGGYFSVWQTTGPGQVVQYMSTFEEGITDVDSYHVLAGSHSHVNWGFTEPGVYEVDFHLSTYVERIVGDVECDCVVDLLDIPAFVDALISPDAFEITYLDCNIMNADVNGDEAIDGADVQAFVDLLTFN
ncbi:MAG TPA: choice-of-anchor M domain-containing protein [Phycisphaerae bacterium]|nr:choice-of-anchor M domain-containing protein [Phycisphaerae bacterium]